jgi:DNA-directed RNA polymerase subunit RPC12/RpoP
MDKLSKDMKACEKAGFGVSYGKWKATQPAVTKKPKEKSGRVCKYCGKEMLINHRGTQRVFCDDWCKMLYGKRSEVEPMVKKCEWCGKTFEAIRSNKRFCCKNCVSLANYYRKKDQD